MGLIPYAFRFATPENDWEALLFRHLPPWLVVSDLRAVTDFFEGEVDFFQRWLLSILDHAHPIMVDCHLLADADFSLFDLPYQAAVGGAREIGVSRDPNSAGNHGGQRGNLQKPSTLDGVWNRRGDQPAQRASVFLSRLALNSCQAIRPQHLLYAEAVECAGEYAVAASPLYDWARFYPSLGPLLFLCIFLSIRQDATVIREHDGCHAPAGVSFLRRAGHWRTVCPAAYHMLERQKTFLTGYLSCISSRPRG